MRRLTAWVLLVAVLFLGGCETARGVGKDMQKAGKWVDKKATR